MKIIFLDIDGVMNSVYDRFSFKLETDKHFVLLKKLINETQAKIVLSSSWRISENSRNDVKNRLKDFGLELFDFTPIEKFGHVKRGDEIREWIKSHPDLNIETFIILDDEADMKEFKENHLVQTNIYDGFTEREFDYALKILNGEKVPERWLSFKKIAKEAEKKFRKSKEFLED